MTASRGQGGQWGILNQTRGLQVPQMFTKATQVKAGALYRSFVGVPRKLWGSHGGGVSRPLVSVRAIVL